MTFSVIVPALNEAAGIEACLQSVRCQSDAELIVADGGSVDGTVAIAEPHARIVTAPRCRARQMNAGAKAATGDVLLFLHADTRLPAGAFAAIESALHDAAVVGGTFRVAFDVDHPLLRLYAFCTRFQSSVFHYGDQGIFVRRDSFELLGGYRDWPIMEDVDLLSRMRRFGEIGVMRSSVVTSARRFIEHGLLRQQLRNAMLLGLYYLRISPHRLANWYRYMPDTR